MSDAASLSITADRDTAYPGGIARVFDELESNVSRDHVHDGVRLSVLMCAVGRRSYGPLLLFLGLLALSPLTIVPGMTTLVAVVTLLVAGQMALGFDRPWLPRKVLEMRVPRRAFFLFIDGCRPVIDRLDGDWLRPRLTFLTVPLFVNLVALCVIAAALVTLPLSLIPFAPIAPSLAIVLFGLGMTARDGLWLSVGVAVTATALWFAAPLVL